MDLTREAIAGVERMIRPHIRRTPVLDVAAAEFGLDGAILNFKLELLQHSGSFKARGAFANLLTRAMPAVGVVAASGSRGSAHTVQSSSCTEIAMPTRWPPRNNGPGRAAQ